MMRLVAVLTDELEADVLTLLQKDPRQLWNITQLVKHFECSRQKMMLAVKGLSSTGKVELVKGGTSWFVRLPPSPLEKKGRVS